MSPNSVRIPDNPEPSPVTVVEVAYPASRGVIGLRGSQAPLSWEATCPPTEVVGDLHRFHLRVPPGEIVELKVVRNDDDWAGGRNYAVHAGDRLCIEPYFESSALTLERGHKIASSCGDIVFDVLLPPSYREQETKRYPVLYVMDGQSLWTTSKDPFGVWGLDQEIDRLYELDAIEELVVVGVHTDVDRVARLSPVKDPEDGGGAGQAFLKALIGPIREQIAANYRIFDDREHTSIMGSSMGGLFAFFAAWSRSPIFGKAACLSSSFWWSDRWPVRWVQAGKAPAERPTLYIDSGASLDPDEADVNARDGFHHTRSMFRALVNHGYEPGKDLHRLVFTGAGHDAASWASRIAVPLQLLFPNDSRIHTGD